MPLPNGWQTRLASPRARKVLLVTLDLFGNDPADPNCHLALQPGARCYATHPNTHITCSAASVTVPYWPYLVDWPTVQRRYWPHERRAEIADVSIEILADSALAADLRARGGVQGMTARIDLWTDGIDLDDVVPLVAGRVSAGDAPRLTGGVRLRITDGNPDRGATLPLGTITRADWPDAPDDVAGLVQRQTILGPFPEGVSCTAISTDGRHWYVCDPACTALPSRIWLNGVEQRIRWTARNSVTPTGLTYTEIVLDIPAQQLAAASVFMACSGGIGLTHDGAIPLLLALGGYRLSPRARGLSDALRRSFDLTALLNASGDAWEIARDRLGAQTPYVLTLHRDQVDIVDAVGVSASWTLGVGTGLLGRLEDSSGETDRTAIINALEILCGRDATAGRELTRVYRDQTHGPMASRSRCARSEATFGRRYQQMPAPDLAVTYDPFGRVAGCPSAERLADAWIARHAQPWRPMTYLADWMQGLAVELGDTVQLTDSDEDFANVDTIVGGISYGPTGPALTLYAEAWA